jgi:hypothetical protein
MASSQSKAWACLMTNVLVLPGLGTLAGGRRATGLVQAVLSLVGVVLACVWLFAFVMTVVRTSELPSDLGRYGGLGMFGLLLAIVSWVWGLASGLTLVREAKQAIRPAGR